MNAVFCGNKTPAPDALADEKIASRTKLGREGQHKPTLMGGYHVCREGDTLELVWNANDNHVYMTGPAAEVFQGEWLGGHPRAESDRR